MAFYKRRYIRGRRFRRRRGIKGTLQRARRGAPLNMRRTRKTLPRRQNICIRGCASATDEVAIPGAATGYLQLLNGMTTVTLSGGGSTYGNNYRTGTEIFMTGLNLDFTLVNSAITGAECRVLVVYDRQCNGSAPTVATLLETNPTGAAVRYNCPLKVESLDRYQVLYDEAFALPATATGADVHRTVLLKLNLPTQYMEGSTSDSVTSIQTGSLYMIAISSDFNTSPSTDIVMEWTSTLTFMNGQW